jgi:hypothetical protein
MKKVCVLGFSGPSNLQANDLPADEELWSMNLCHRFLQRPAQRWFQMHHRMHNLPSDYPGMAATQQGLIGHFGRPIDHEEWLARCGIPVYMQDVDDQIPTSVRYPIERVVDRLGGYLTSTAAYMIALALYEGVDRLQLLGIYMKTGSEYAIQRPSIEYLLGAAKVMGVEVVLPLGCDLAQAPLYAYGEFENPTGALQLESVGIMAPGKTGYPGEYD